MRLVEDLRNASKVDAVAPGRGGCEVVGLDVWVGRTQSCLVWHLNEMSECSVISNGLEEPSSRPSICFKIGRKTTKKQWVFPSIEEGGDDGPSATSNCVHDVPNVACSSL